MRPRIDRRPTLQHRTMYPRSPANGRHDDTYHPPTTLSVAVAVAAAVPLTLFALAEPALLVGAFVGAVAVAVAR
ncbi:hypothetical protein Hbl1158_09255 [Halobaculum sp. CBA1158]|uniref:hypothetical protein n=1 Tax=Halobaculum sp. CBA1158 TaxID=2904243 RepID=UPI001F1CDA25|nr:hypothetical protein [Halobaculum sp. CBA1158]UIO98732.1 hypothetical protein Hbl1158_09255 [Halobaculum sp. CBA1158]